MEHGVDNELDRKRANLQQHIDEWQRSGLTQLDYCRNYGIALETDNNTDWPTGDIIEASLARWQVEDRFHLSKDNDLVGTSPVRHWADSKIRCHLFTCVVAMNYLRRIELKMAAAGRKRSIEEVMDDMRHLHYVLRVKKGSRTPERRLGTPSKTQSEVLSAFGYHVDERGVLQGSAG